MHEDRTGQTAVIFLSRRRDDGDGPGYAADADAMAALAAAQPGCRGIDSARAADGAGITISWWADEAAAIAWRAHADHAAVRDRGRARWYDSYLVAVGRAYAWDRK